MSNPELGQCVRRELLLLHQSLACNIKHPNICMLGKADSWYRHKISYFLRIVFLDWEKLNQLPHKQTNKNTQWNFFSQCTLSEEMYCVGRTTQGLTGLEIDLTDDWKFNRNTQKRQVRKACCRSVAAELPSIGRHVYSQTVLILISFNLSQFIGWALPRSIIPNRLAKIVPYLGIAFELQLQWSEFLRAVRFCNCTWEAMFETQLPNSAWATWKKANLLYSSHAAEKGTCFSCMAPIASSASKAPWGTSTRQITWLRLFSVTGSLPQPKETAAVHCINKSAIYIRK